MSAGAQIIRFPDRRAREGGLWEPWLSETAIAQHFGGISTRTIRRWRRQGMPSRLNGGLRQYRITDCENWHAARQHTQERTVPATDQRGCAP